MGVGGEDECAGANCASGKVDQTADIEDRDVAGQTDGGFVAVVAKARTRVTVGYRCRGRAGFKEIAERGVVKAEGGRGRTGNQTDARRN